MGRNRQPDAYVTATDRNGRVLARREFNGAYNSVEPRIARAHDDLFKRYGPDCYIFINIYC